MAATPSASLLRLHRCSWGFAHAPFDACTKVERALRDRGIAYEVVKHGFLASDRSEVVALSGQEQLPVLELPDGTAYRAESVEMAARIRAGELG